MQEHDLILMWSEQKNKKTAQRNKLEMQPLLSTIDWFVLFFVGINGTDHIYISGGHAI